MSDYWEERKGYRYYQDALDLCWEHARHSTSVVDVGCYSTRFLEWLAWIPYRVALDRLKPAQVPDVQVIRADFLEWVPTQRFDLVLCMQVLEHVERAGDFAKKLLSIGGIVIASVPYKWLNGNCVHHVHDPVDVPKLESWFGRSFDEAKIVQDIGMERLIAVYK